MNIMCIYQKEQIEELVSFIKEKTYELMINKDSLQVEVSEYEIMDIIESECPGIFENIPDDELYEFFFKKFGKKVSEDDYINDESEKKDLDEVLKQHNLKLI